MSVRAKMKCTEIATRENNRYDQTTRELIPSTAAGAIARWQAAHGLDADGVAGPMTLAAMGLA